jgi:hypothetical protein
MLFAAVHESAFGTKRTFQTCSRLSAFGQQRTKVHFGPGRFCPLMTQSGHPLRTAAWF